MEIDVRTDLERARDERHKFICDNFLQLRNEMPECPPHRIFRVIAQKVGMTIPGVINVVTKNGLYQSKSN